MKIWDRVERKHLQTLGLTEGMTKDRDFSQFVVLGKTHQAK